MSIKIYNEVTGQWEVRGTNQANVVEIEDVTGELETEDVEGALINLVDMIEEVDEEVYDIKKQVMRTDDKVNSLLEEFHYHLDNHPSGGGDGVMPTITSTQEGDILVDKGSDVKIPIFYSSGNLGDGIAYILVNNIEMGSQTVKQGSNMINFGVMPNQTNTISVYVKDRGGLLSNQLTWNVICGGIEVTTTFDWEADYPMGEDVLMPFTIETQSEEPIIMYLTIDQDIVMVNCQKGYNEYIFSGLGVGVHRISFYIESGKYKTNTYSYNMVVVDSNNLYVSTTWASEQEVSFGSLISINYRVSKASTENFTINLYLDGVLEKTLTAPAGSYYWTITRLPIGYHTLKIEATGVQGDYSFVETDVTIIEGVYVPVEPVSGGLLAYFNAKNKTNQDDNKEIWEDLSGNGVLARLHNFNYGNNGWMGNYLQCSGDSYVEIELQPYLDNVKNGSTIDIHFNMTSVGIDEARVLDYTELEKPYKGIYIDTLETKLVSETSTGLVKLDEDTDTRLTYVIDRQNRLAIIYLNGVINRVFQLSDTGSGVNATFEDFSHKEKIYLNSRKGQDLFADCKIYSLRVYGRALSHEEVLQNHIADIDDLEEQEKAYNRNYANTEIPEIRMYGDTSNMTGEIFQTMRIKYISPNEELYGQSFDTMYNQVRWQGTSSQQYNMKNYQVYLRDNNMADMYYTPFPNGIPEHIFCFKCNYMESSHMNNTGIATFANDCVFTTPNPAQTKNPLVRNSINGFPCLMYINDELEGVYTFNLDRYSTNSLGYDTTQFPKCLSYEISANSDTGAGAFVPWTSATGKTEREYIASDFRCRFPDNRVNGDDDFAELKRLIDWVGNATDDMFREQIDQYFNLEYLIRYYLTVMCFGLVDNLGKNTMLTTFDGNVWYMQLYDCDSSTGLDNSGAMKFEPDIEVEVGIFNTSNSRLWEKLRNNFPSQILAQWEILRLSYFTEENIMNYLNEKISNKIPEINYNLDAWKKYITMGTEFLFACHGNRKHQITRWIRERLIYMDTLLGYTVSTNDYITIRANKLGEVYLDIQVFQPMYFSVKFRNEENGTGIITKRISRGETVRFSYNLPVATDQEILVYGGRFIKDLGDLTNMNPTNLLLGNGTRLTRVKCNNSPMLINASIGNCTMLQEVDLRGCSNLGGGSDASLQTLDLSKCRNLRKVDIYGTQLTALYTSQQGGIIQEIVYPYSIQIVRIQNQARLTSLGIPCYYIGNYNDERNIFAERLSEMTVSNCPNVKTFVKNYYMNEDGSEVPIPTFIGVSKGRTFNLSNVMGHLTQIDLSYCSNIESLTLDNFNNLTEINFDDIAPYNATTSNLHNLTLTNCPNVETLTFNQNTVDGEDSLGVAFKEGTVLDLSGLYNLKHIRSNVGVKGLKKLILPLTIQSLVFDYPKSTTYAYGESDIEDIFSKNASHETDGFKGIDLLDIETITDFSMGSLTKINNAINLDVKITDTFPYINYFKTDNYFKPEGTIDISEYKGSLEYLFKGVDLDKLTVVCSEPLPHTSAKYMFAYASSENVEILNTLFSYMPNVTDFSYMFYHGYLKHAPLIPTRAKNVSYMFYNNETMETTPSNWLQAYPITPISDYCYTGCANINSIDGAEGSIDVIPVAWGGFDRKNAVASGETIIVEQTLEREFVNFTASGQTFQNIVPEVGQTPTLIANKSEQPVGEGMPTNILLADGLMPEAELEGFTLANLASEKRSSKMTCNQTENDIRAGLNDTFIIEDGGVISQLELDGLTLVNIMPDTGKTQLVSNNDGSYQIDKGLDEGIILDTGKMLSSKMYGETIINCINERSNKTPLLTLDSTNPTNSIATIETELYEDYEKNIKIQDGGEIKRAILKGNTGYRDIDTGEFLETFEEGRNLELVSVKMPVLTTSNEDGTKTNILSTPSDLELRGIGDVQDTLDCLTGEVVQSIYNLQLTGDESWGQSGFTNDDYFVAYTTFTNNLSIAASKVICDKLNYDSSISVTNTKTEGINIIGDCSLRISLSKTKVTTLNDFINWIRQEQPVINFVAKEKSIKTVDLKCVNQDDEPIDKCCTFTDGHIFIESDGIISALEYSLSTTNYFELNQLQTNVNYTLRFDGDATSGTLGGSIINTVNDTLVATSATDNILYLDGDVSNVMLLEGNYTGRDIPYFTGMRSVEAIEVETSNSDSSIQSTIQLPPHIQLHSLPDGTRDEVDIKTGILTRKTYRVKITGSNSNIKYSIRDVNVQGNITMQCKIEDVPKRKFSHSITKTYCDFNVIPFVGNVSFSESAKENVGCGWYAATNMTDTFCIRIPISYLEELTLEAFKELLNKNPINIVYELETPTTEQLILNYNNSCDYGRILPTGMCDKYDVVNSMYTQTMASILLDGANTWDAMEEFENTVKFTATGTTVGVENLNMLGAGGLYCDNDLFPNINDDSDVEHCRVDEAGNKFYIYISKDRLMSPDLIGYQIWLQANPFNLIYELAEHLIYVKPYEELDATQARWEGMDCIRDGTIKYHANNSDNITIYPTLEYVAPSINNFEVTMLEPNTDYTIYAEGINTNDTINLGGTDINFNNGTVYTSGDNQWLRIDNNDSFYNMVITKGDTTGEVVPYFEGMTSVENPKVQCGESTVSYTDLKLRSLSNGVKDTINVVTGEYVQRIGEREYQVGDLENESVLTDSIHTMYELAEPIITKLDSQTLLAYEDGTINLSSDTGLLPTTHYSVPFTNTFNLPSMKTGTRYTLKYPSASGSITIGDITYKISGASMLFTTPLKINGDTSAIIFSDANPENVVLLEGAYNTREVPYFTGVKSVKNPNITIIDQLSTESNTYNCATEIELRGLPNGVADKLDIVKGKLTTNVGVRPYQEGDENLPNVWTDGYETVYALSSPVVTNVAIDHPTVTTNSLIELSSDYLIPQLNYRAPSSNNFPLDLLQPNTTYTLYADALVSGSYALGGTKTGIYSQPHTITLGDMTDNLLTFNGDLGLSNVMLVKGNSLKTTLPPYFLGIRSVTDGHLSVEGMAGEMNELTFDEGIVLRDCNGVKDTIDLTTCTLIKHTGEITLTGVEGWNILPDDTINDDLQVFTLTLLGINSSINNGLICDKFMHKHMSEKPQDTEAIYSTNNQLRLVVKKSRIGGDTVNALKSWLNQNHTTVVYPLTTPLEIPLKNVWTTLPPTSYNNQTEISSSVSNNSLKPMISVTIATTTLEEIVSNLEAQNAELENENIATMLALTDVYEMMCMSMPTTMNLSNEDLEEIEEEVEVTSMGMIYAKLIHKGLKTIDQVPYFLQREVKYALKQM